MMITFVLFFVFISIFYAIFTFSNKDKKVEDIVIKKSNDGKTKSSYLKFLEPKDRENKSKNKIRSRLETLHKEGMRKSNTIEDRLEKAGIFVDKHNAFLILGFFVSIMVIVIHMVTNNVMLSAAMGISISIFFFYQILHILSLRRQKKFILEFAGSLDIIIRGLKTGMPLSDCMKLIALESKEPLRSEFAYLIESEKMGMTLSQALENLYRRMPLPEVNFFSIVIQINRKTGGNLAEALANLSDLLRQRRIMKEKIIALSMEARVSTMIIASLPFLTGLIVSLTNPMYLAPLFTTDLGKKALMVAALLMVIGTFVLKSMMKIQ